jgi:hypothetical protein
MTWHVDRSMLARYVSGDLGDASVLSIEAHLLSCAECRDALPPFIDPARLDRMWTGVRDIVHAPRPRVAERLLVRLGVRDHVARLLVVAPSLQLAWLASMVVSLAFAVIASHWFGGGNLPFLVVAPIVPVVGVAWSFDGPRDPVWEIGRTTATGGLRLTLIRSVAVLGVSAVVSAITSLALPRPGWGAAAWLLPALALTVLTLALSTTSVSTEPAAGSVCAGWVVAVVVASRAGSDQLAAFGAPGQAVVGVVLAVSTAVLIVRRDALDRQLRSRRSWG